jgi:hypothetical protein
MASREIILTRIGIALEYLQDYFGMSGAGNRDYRVAEALERCVAELRLARPTGEPDVVSLLALCDAEILAADLGMKKESAAKIIEFAKAKTKME